jgi:selenocysteine lyase/cysteine desulfurase
VIHERVRCLTGWLIDNLFGLNHANGRPLVRIYGPTNLEKRGGTITFNLYDQNGRLFDFRRIEELAGKINISLRTGCFCNPGAGEISEGLTEADIAEGFTKELTFPQFIAVIEHRSGKSAGAIRASVGLATNYADVHHFMNFIRGFLNKDTDKIGAVEFDIQTCRVIRDGS